MIGSLINIPATDIAALFHHISISLTRSLFSLLPHGHLLKPLLYLLVVDLLGTRYLLEASFVHQQQLPLLLISLKSSIDLFSTQSLLLQVANLVSFTDSGKRVVFEELDSDQDIFLVALVCRCRHD